MFWYGRQLAPSHSGLELRPSGMFFFRHVRWPVAAVLVVVVSLSPHVLRWSSTGMENGIVVLLWAVSLLAWDTLHLKKHKRQTSTLIFAGCSWALLPLARPELGLFALFLGGATFWQLVQTGRIRSGIWLASASLFTAAVSLGFVWLAFESFVPQTAAAKDVALHHPNPLYGLTQSAKIFLSGAGPLALLLAYLAVYKVNTLKSVWTGAVCLGVLGAIGYLATVNQLISTRYATYLSFPIVVTAAYTAASKLDAWSWITKIAFIGQVATSIALLIYLFPATNVSEAQSFSPVANEFEQATEGQSPRVAVREVGAFGFFSDAYIIDLVGLTDRKTLRWLQTNSAELTDKNLEDLLLTRRATHYIEYDERCEPPQFDTLRPNLMMEADVERNNLTGGSIQRPHLCIYALNNGRSTSRKNHEQEPDPDRKPERE